MHEATRRVREEQTIRHLKTCVWPLCEKPPDHVLHLPVCAEHRYRIARLHQELAAVDHQLTLARLREIDRPTPDPVRAARTTGQIYFVRLNGIIKVGFSQHLQVRLQDYTVGAELLAHHQGTRADERDLHRTFKPFLVHGREWYRADAQVLLDHIAAVLAEHGPPVLQVERNTQTSQGAHVKARSKRRAIKPC